MTSPRQARETGAEAAPVTLEEMGGWPFVLGRLSGGDDLSATEAGAALSDVLEGNATPSQLAAFIFGLRCKGETVEEMTGLVRAMTAAAESVPVSAEMRDCLIDTCGTGGDRSGTINISTIAAFVVAGAGVPVCKHGGRASSSRAGSADLLEALGVAIELSPAGVTHGWVKPRRKAEADTRLIDATGHTGRRQLDRHSQRLEEVGRAGS